MMTDIPQVLVRKDSVQGFMRAIYPDMQSRLTDEGVIELNVGDEEFAMWIDSGFYWDKCTEELYRRRTNGSNL